MMARLVALGLLGLAFTVSSAAAQPLGTFRWQLQPYCNVLTVNVTQQAGIYTLDGTDDRCGAAQAASALGAAFLNPSGLVGFGFTVVLPNGAPVHIEATIDISSLSGTWRDSGANSGTFCFHTGCGNRWAAATRAGGRRGARVDHLNSYRARRGERQSDCAELDYRGADR
jgi:hypothetical protein